MPQQFTNYRKIQIRLSDERDLHITSTHPEMANQTHRISETLQNPDIVVKSRTDDQVELYYKLYQSTPVTTKYMCVVVKNLDKDPFIITIYFTDAIKKGDRVWKKK